MRKTIRQTDRQRGVRESVSVRERARESSKERGMGKTDELNP